MKTNAPEDKHAPEQIGWKRRVFFIFSTLFIAYSVNIYFSSADNEITLSPEAGKGKQLFQDYNCGACHQLYGLGGYMGPDLTNVISNPYKGEAYATAFIKSGTVKMPNFNLNDYQISCLVEYLKQIDKTGHSPVRNFEVYPWGDVDYKQ